MVRARKPKPDTPLTRKELRVLVRMAAGETKITTAQKLHLSPHTVHTHTINIMARTDTRNLEKSLAVSIARGEIKVTAPEGTPEPPINGRLLEVLVRLARGQTREQIARDLGFSFQTIKNDITKLYRLLGAKSRIHLVYRGFETGNLVINRRKKQ